jgi:hypothetical protein
MPDRSSYDACSVNRLDSKPVSLHCYGPQAGKCQEHPIATIRLLEAPAEGDLVVVDDAPGTQSREYPNPDVASRWRMTANSCGSGEWTPPLCTTAFPFKLRPHDVGSLQIA